MSYSVESLPLDRDVEEKSHLEHLEAIATVPANPLDEEIDDDGLPPGYFKSYKFIGSMAAIVLLANSLFIGYSMPVNILSVINEDIGPSSNYTLISLLYTLLQGVGLLVVGRISDITGRRWFIMGSMFCGLIGAVICAKAATVNTVIAGTALTAVASWVQSLYPLLVAELIPNKHRPLGQAAITLSILPTLGFGTVIVRFMVANPALGWRWCYWLNVIVIGVALVLFFFCYFPPSFEQLNEGTTKWQQLKQLDFLGMFLYAAGLILMLLGFSWSQGEYPWTSGYVIGPLVSGIATLVGFVLYELYAPIKEPLLPMHLFKITNFNMSVIVGTVGQMVFYALNILWPAQITSLYSTDNITIGLMSATTGAALAFGEIIAGATFKLLGPPKWQLVASSALLTLFLGLMAMTTQYNMPLAITFTAVAGLCVGWVELITIVIVGLVVPPEDIGASQGYYASIRAVGGTIATSIYVSIYTNRLTGNLPANIVPAAEAAGLPASSITSLLSAVTNGTAAALEAVPGMSTAVETVVGTATMDAYAQSFKTVYLASLAFGGLAIIASFFTSDVKMFLTNHVNKAVSRDVTDAERARNEKLRHDDV